MWKWQMYMYQTYITTYHKTNNKNDNEVLLLLLLLNVTHENRLRKFNKSTQIYSFFSPSFVHTNNKRRKKKYTEHKERYVIYNVQYNGII